GDTHDAFRSLAKIDLVIGSPRRPEWICGIAKCHSRAAGDCNFFELPLRKEAHPTAIRREEGIKDSVLLHRHTGNRPRFNVRHPSKIQLLIGHIDDVGAIRGYRNQVTSRIAETLILRKHKQESHYAGWLNCVQCTDSKDG